MMMLRRRTDPKTQDDTLCEPAPWPQWKCTSTCHKTRFIQKFTAKMPQTRTAAHTLCEPAQSKCTSWKFTGKMPRPGLSPERGHTLGASLRNRNALQHFTRATLYGNLQEKCLAQIEPTTRAHTLREPAQPKCTSTIPKFTGKMPRPRLSPERGHTLCASLRSRNALQHVTRAILYGNLPEKCRAQIERRMRTHTLSEPAQSKCTSAFKFHKSHFERKFVGKMPCPRVSTLIKHRPLLLP